MVKIQNKATGLFLTINEFGRSYTNEGSEFTPSQANAIVNGQFTHNLIIVDCTQNETIHTQHTTKDVEVQETLETAKELDVTPSDAPESNVSTSQVYTVQFTHLRYGSEYKEIQTVSCKSAMDVELELESLGYDVLQIHNISW